MEIRRLGSSDYAILASAIQTLIPADERDNSVASNSHLQRALDDSASYFIVCMLNSACVGFLSAFRFPEIQHDYFQVYLYDIVVNVNHRGEGIGSRMIEGLKTYCAQDGVDHIWVGTSHENDAAQRTFERTGAEKVSETYIEYVYRLRDPPNATFLQFLHK